MQQVNSYLLNLLSTCMSLNHLISIGRAMKALTYATMKNLSCCLKCIESGGLKYIFPVFMGRGLPYDLEKKKPTHPDRLELEHASIAIISQICSQFLTMPVTMKRTQGLAEARYLSTVSDRAISEAQQRFLGKFLENDYEKVDRLVEFFIKYRTQLMQVEASLADDAQEEELDEDEILTRRMEGGLDHLQDLAIILAYGSMIDNTSLVRIDSKLTEYQLNILDVYSSIEENVAILQQNFDELKRLKKEEEEKEAGLAKKEDDLFLEDELAIERMSMIKDKYLQALIASGVVDVEDQDDSKNVAADD
jgi:hypothetical protein